MAPKQLANEAVRGHQVVLADETGRRFDKNGAPISELPRKICGAPIGKTLRCNYSLHRFVVGFKRSGFPRLMLPGSSHAWSGSGLVFQARLGPAMTLR